MISLKKHFSVSIMDHHWIYFSWWLLLGSNGWSELRANLSQWVESDKYDIPSSIELVAWLSWKLLEQEGEEGGGSDVVQGSDKSFSPGVLPLLWLWAFIHLLKLLLTMFDMRAEPFCLWTFNVSGFEKKKR